MSSFFAKVISTMNVHTTTQGSGQNIVFLHGMCDDSRYFAPIIKQLEKDYCLTLFDQPGNGKTSWFDNPQTLYDLVEQFLPVLPEKAIYIGWSMGGPLAIALAAHHSERVERIIAIASTTKFIEDTDWPGMPNDSLATMVNVAAREVGMPTFLREFMETEFSQFSPKPDAFYEINQIIDESIPEDIDAITQRAIILDASDQRSDLAKLHCPVDFILGQDDVSVPVSSHEKIEALNNNVTVHVIETAKHAPFWTHPKEFESILDGILAK